MKAEDIKNLAIPVAVLGGLFFLFRKSAKQKREDLETGQVNREINESRLSFPKSQYAAMATKLEQAFFDIGSDEAAVYNVFRQLKNNDDFLQLKKAYGVRQYTGGLVPGFLSGKLDLDGWIAQELNENEIKYINGILSARSIIYRF